MKDYHCCATCIHFSAQKDGFGTRYFCRRLGYETKTNYQFHCWNPREDIQKLMKRQGEGKYT